MSANNGFTLYLIDINAPPASNKDTKLIANVNTDAQIFFIEYSLRFPNLCPSLDRQAISAPL